jgi:hypothetical protein
MFRFAQYDAPESGFRMDSTSFGLPGLAALPSSSLSRFLGLKPQPTDR